ncbi:hypothetical protein ACFXDE_09825 [Kitasatospora sp. NPDC059408]
MTVADVKALMLACLTREFTQPEEGSRERLLDVVRRGLRPEAD